MTGPDLRRVEYVPLDEITPAPRNPRQHEMAGLRGSIARFGFVSPALRDERTGRLVVGHGRTQALRQMRDDGDTPPAGVRLDGGRWLIPVVCGWSSRSDVEAEAYLLADNRYTELGGWDDADLAAMLADIGEVDAELLAATGFTDDDLAGLLAEAEGGGGRAGLTDPDDVPDVPVEAVTQPGDVWILGSHRLVCGDATNPDHVDLALRGLGDPGIVYTDPPYGIKAVGSDGKVGDRHGYQFGGAQGSGKVIPTQAYAPVAGDDTTQTASDAFRLAAVSYPDARHIWWGGNHYAASAGLPDSPGWLVWDKEANGDFADAELAWTNHPGAVRLLRHMWNGMLRASERGKRVHPTQKPVALAEWAFGVVDPKRERRVVLDVFAGSGSTLIAANRTGRVAALCEVESAYCDVIARRWQEHTGDLPILEATGEPHDFTPELSTDPALATT